MTIFANERDSGNMSVETSEPDRERQAEERPIPGYADFKCKSASLELNRLEGGDVLVVSKLHPGFDDECVDDLTRLLSAISLGRTARPNIWCSISRIDAGAKRAARWDSGIWSSRTRAYPRGSSYHRRLGPLLHGGRRFRIRVSLRDDGGRKGRPFLVRWRPRQIVRALCVAGA